MINVQELGVYVENPNPSRAIKNYLFQAQILKNILKNIKK